MTETWITLIVAIVGSSAVSAVVTGIFTLRKQNADASKVLQDLWHGELDRLKTEVAELRTCLNNREVVIETLKAENKQLRLDLEELRCKYEGQLQQNTKLRLELDTVIKANEDLTQRIRKLEGCA